MQLEPAFPWVDQGMQNQIRKAVFTLTLYYTKKSGIKGKTKRTFGARQQKSTTYCCQCAFSFLHHCWRRFGARPSSPFTLRKLSNKQQWIKPIQSRVPSDDTSARIFTLLEPKASGFIEHCNKKIIQDNSPIWNSLEARNIVGAERTLRSVTQHGDPKTVRNHFHKLASISGNYP